MTNIIKKLAKKHGITLSPDKPKKSLDELLLELIQLQRKNTQFRLASDYQTTYNDSLYLYIDAFIQRYHDLFKEHQINTDYDNTNITLERINRMHLVKPQITIHGETYTEFDEVLNILPTIKPDMNYRGNIATSTLLLEYANDEYFIDRMHYCATQALYGSSNTKQTPHDIVHVVLELINIL